MATNLRHRTTPNAFYSLRGHAPTAISSQTALQRRKNAVGKSVQKKWRITRDDRSTRGLHRAGTMCFLLGGIQVLLHLPKFVNWILSHNSTRGNGAIKFPCRPLHEVAPLLITGLVRPAPVELESCPACVVKEFVQNYWGHVDIQRDGRPSSWRHSHAQMAALRRLDRQLLPLTYGAGVSDHEDPSEFQDRLLQACLASTDTT
jgi:hypothetical protein